MAASLAPTLTNADFNNWLKGALAILFAKEGLTDFVGTEINKCHNSLLQLVPKVNVHQLCSCTIASLPGCTSNTPHRHIPTPGKTFPRNTKLCSRGVCHVLMDGICQDHRFRDPSWKNTDPQKWCTDPYEIAKCYMPPDGYVNKLSMVETDFNGTLAIIINNKAFQTKLQANLATTPNICTKLKTNTLTIHANDITEVLNDSVRETLSEQEQQYLRSIEDHFSKLQTDSISELEKLVDRKKTELEEIARNQMIQYQRLNHGKSDEEKLEDLKEDLIKYYRDRESTISLSPLADEHDVDVINFYVKPPLSAYVKPHILSHTKTAEEGVIGNLNITDPNPQKQGNNAPHKQTISSYLELFFHNQSNIFRKIYVTADAGLGKTSLCKHITMNWCQSQRPEKSFSGKYEADDLKAMKEFDLLFLLYLREHVESGLCHLDSLVQNICPYLSRHSQYTKGFLETVLHEKRCLIILDGLDEWAHPNICQNKNKTPHNIHPESCTVLTTLRPWKLGTVGLGSHDIDRHVEICALDYWRSRILEKNTIQILNEINQNDPPKCVYDFELKVRSIGEISNNPYIKLHLICLWFEGSPIGQTRCEIYSNIMELILRRGMKKNCRLYQSCSCPNTLWSQTV